MIFRSRPFLLAALALVALPLSLPAPLIYRVGEGWTYERVDEKGDWVKGRAKDQMAVAEEALTKKDHKLALKAARRTVTQWPLSDFAPRAQYLVARCYEEKGDDERAFKEYQKILDKYPKIDNHAEITQRQYDIATRFLNGKWFRLWGLVPVPPVITGHDKTISMYEDIIKSGPYSEIAPQAQMQIGAANEKREEFPLAVKAYERAADRYSERKTVSADALYRAGLAYHKQAQTAEYDQDAAAQAIAAFTDFKTLYPDDKRVAEADNFIAGMKSEQARGAFRIAEFYEKRKMWSGARVYYNEVVARDPASSFAPVARQRIEVLNTRLGISQPAAATNAPIAPKL